MQTATSASACAPSSSNRPSLPRADEEAPDYGPGPLFCWGWLTGLAALRDCRKKAAVRETTLLRALPITGTQQLRRPVLDTGPGYLSTSPSGASTGGYHWSQRSSQSGLSASVSANFHSLRHFLTSFSRAMAVCHNGDPAALLHRAVMPNPWSRRKPSPVSSTGRRVVCLGSCLFPTHFQPFDINNPCPKSSRPTIVAPGLTRG